MAMIEFSIVPLGTESLSLSKYIARAIEVIRKEGIKYSITAMGTIVEGDLGQLVNLVPKMHEAVFATGVERIYTVVKIDDRRDKISTTGSKVASLEEELRRGQ